MSYSDYDEQLMRQIIMDHYKNPRQHGLLTADAARDYLTVHLKNPSCGDDLTLQIKPFCEAQGAAQTKPGDAAAVQIADIRQEVSGCSICSASTSMLCELIAGASLKRAKLIVDNFIKMVESEAFDQDLLDEAVSLQGVAHLPQRVKCATLGWLALDEAIKRILTADSSAKAD